MIPLKDDIPSQRYPVVTVTVITLNLLVFVFEASLSSRQLQALIYQYGIVPVYYTIPEITRLFHPVELIVPLFSSMFLHGGWIHVLGNMWMLWIFGDNVEDSWGRARFLLFYIAGGMAAGLVHIFTNLSSKMPTIGASGAVAAVMGAYFLLYPRARVIVMFPPFILGPFFIVPAALFLGFWFILQFFNGALSLFSTPGQFGGIAWWAHIGGFLFGAFLCSVLHVQARVSKRRPLFEEDDDQDRVGW